MNLKTTYLFLLSACIGFITHAQTLSVPNPNSNNKQVLDTPTVKPKYKVYGISAKFTTRKQMELNPDTLFQVDTGLTDVHQYDPVLDRHNHYTFLGNNASPSVPLFFDYNHQIGFNYGLHQWDVYRMTDENMLFYHTRSPYSDFQYVQGPKDLQYFKAIHSQNITPYWNISLSFRKYYSTGFYDHQLSNGYNFGLNTWYRSKSRRYMLVASAIWNTFRYQENGGLVNDSFFQTNSPNADHIGMPFRLMYATQEWKDQSYNIRQYFYIGTKEYKKIHDTDKAPITLYYPRFFVSHELSVYNMRYNYYDSSTDMKQFGNILIDSTRSNDFYRYRNISNTFSIGQVEYHPPNKEAAPISILLNAYVKHELILARYPTKDTTVQNILAGGGILFRTPFFKIHGDATIIPIGYNQGDFSIAGKIEFPYKIMGYNNVLGLGLSNQQSRPAFLDQNLYSNHFEWNNNFIRTRYYEAQGFLASDSFHYRFTAKYMLISSLVYYGYNVLPQQAQGDLNYFQLSAEKDFKIGNLHLNNSLLYQHVSGGNEISVPDLSFRGSYFYELTLFNHALVMQIGFDVRYNSSYYAYAYAPGISNFYLQNYKQIGNYPYFDPFISGRISRFRIFAKMEHATQGLFGYTYYATPSYPFYPRTIVRLGLRWMFYN